MELEAGKFRELRGGCECAVSLFLSIRFAHIASNRSAKQKDMLDDLQVALALSRARSLSDVLAPSVIDT